ncbi:DUF1573 domain-containing protein [Gynurincola endophyticus]|uniref:DUF1573 domain-containing protein n=1 Tax=Gynurincola endophyticus TaxID=2479004 RepID=UPI000F8D4184|nr:DUF1573 domain-containing protein [Gynurincola endophyticus]
MNRFFFLFFMATAFLSCKNSEQEHKSNAIFSTKNDSVNIGAIHQNDTAYLSFTVYNPGSDTLKILNIGTECGCTVAEVSKKNIIPGDSALLSVTYSSTSDIGIIVKTIVVECNTTDPYHLLYLTADVKK